jgi:hypothetical protein
MLLVLAAAAIALPPHACSLPCVWRLLVLQFQAVSLPAPPGTRRSAQLLRSSSSMPQRTCIRMVDDAQRVSMHVELSEC